MSGATGSARPAWEYKYVIRRSSRLDEFQKALSTNAVDGWEYVGTETLQVADSNRKGDLEAPILVFKRPTRAARGGGGGGGGGSGSGGGLGGGFGSGQGFSGGKGLAGGQGLSGGMAGFSGGALGIGGTNNPLGGGGIGGIPSMPGQPANKARQLGDMAGGGTVLAGGMKGGSAGEGTGAATRSEIQIIPLKHAPAASMAKTLQELFGDSRVRIVAEQETNSIWIQADPLSLETIKKVLERVDRPAKGGQ
jgi:hypothetical protein